MSWTPRSLAEQTGRTFVITGANSGIGLETARELVSRGATVVLACRDLAKGQQARDRIVRGASGNALVLPLDLTDLDSVTAFSQDLRNHVPTLSALVCNAGVMGGAQASTKQGLERQMGTNHFGHAALIAGLWPQLEQAAGRVVLVSSIAARGGDLSAATSRADLVAPDSYNAGQVYARSKQANLLYAQELHRRARTAGSAVSVVACHPGVSATNLFGRQLRDQGKAWLAPFAAPALRVIAQSPRAGAGPTLRALHHSTPSGAFVGPTRLNQWRGCPELLEVYPQGADQAAAGRLWELTTEVLGASVPV